METGDPRTGGEPHPPAQDADAVARRAEADLAALRAERRPLGRAPPRRTGLLALVLLVLLAALAARWALRHREPPPARTREAGARTAEEKLSRIEAQNWSHVEIIAPREQRGEPPSREAGSPFQGFAISVSSSPAGARVLVDGDEKGKTPLAASVDCEPGRDVQVSVEKAGYRAQRRAVRCRADALVRLSVRLEKAAAIRR
jgi:PEGA domain